MGVRTRISGWFSVNPGGEELLQTMMHAHQCPVPYIPLLQIIIIKKKIVYDCVTRRAFTFTARVHSYKSTKFVSMYLYLYVFFTVFFFLSLSLWLLHPSFQRMQNKWCSLPSHYSNIECTHTLSHVPASLAND